MMQSTSMAAPFSITPNHDSAIRVVSTAVTLVWRKLIDCEDHLILTAENFKGALAERIDNDMAQATRGEGMKGCSSVRTREPASYAPHGSEFRRYDQVDPDRWQIGHPVPCGSDARGSE
jgi:hypothetical protein